MNSTKHLFSILLTALAVSCASGSTSDSASDLAAEEESSEARFARYVTELSADRMEGRGLGTAGLELAADWIEQRLVDAGLEPAFGPSYRQPFDVKVGVSLGEENQLSGIDRDDWTPLGMSSAGPISGEVVFAGYGITAPPIGYDDYENLDVDGKIVLILRYEPQEADEASPFDGRRPSRWSALRYKIRTARNNGASAVIFATGPMQADEEDRLPALRNDGPMSPAGVPVIQVRSSVAREWLEQSGHDLAELQSKIDRDLKPRSTSLDLELQGRVSIHPEWASTENVAGLLPGRGPLASEMIVVGAHYDHLGMGGSSSMRPNEVAIHNGADDNASGTAAVILAAEDLASRLSETPNRRSILFALFSAEETGLAGSARMADLLVENGANIRAMINLDMVGRLRNGKLNAMGTETAAEWDALLEAIAEDHSIEIAGSGDGYGPSDQTSFYAIGAPVIHFFTGAHDEYHTPEDDAETINFEGGALVASITADTTAALATGDVNPVFVRASSEPLMQGDGRGYGSYLGTVPDFGSMNAESGGVLLTDVRAGGPADLAGIRGGDTIVEMAGTRIENLYDMTYALQDHRPGETISIGVIRDGEPLRMMATLGDRSRRSATPAANPHAGNPSLSPANPHSTMPEVQEEPPFELPEFYQGKPGGDFVIGAGERFERAFEGETRFSEIRQLTFGGENAEAYFSPDGRKLIYQATKPGMGCDQQFILDLASGEEWRVSSGEGRTTCGYFDWPEGDRVAYATTESGSAECPPAPDRSAGYVWPVYDSFQLVTDSVRGGSPTEIASTDGYDAELTWCHRGGSFVFTSDRTGDLELYVGDEAGHVTQITDTPGYDGGAFFSPDCSKIVWRASRPAGEALADYRRLLARNMVRPSKMEIFVMDADGSNSRQVTSNGAANFCPYFHPDGNRILYSSNAASASGREFDIWMTDETGTLSEQITTAPGFDGFPMFSPDGEWIVWASNRANPEGRETNLYIARWNEK